MTAITGLACGSSACDRGAPAQPGTELRAAAPARDFASGSRLRASFHLVDGLVEVLTTFHDLVLDVDCAYDDESGAHVGPDGASYCFPRGMARHREGKGPYLDAACTMPAAFAPAGSTAGVETPPAAHVLIEPRDACVTAPEVRLARPPQQRRIFLRDDEGACVEVERGSVQPFGDVVPLASFVRAFEQVEPRDGRIAVRVRVGEDGSRQVVGGFDRLRDEPSRVGLLADGSRRWLPARVAFVGGGELLFADQRCATPAATKIARTASCPLGAAVVLEGSCGAGSYFALGARLEATFAPDATNACAARSAPDLLAFALGPAIASSAYAGVSVSEVGSARVRRRGLGAGGDLPVAWAELIDAESGEPCEVASTADGSLRCLPSTSEVVSFFADEACAERAFAHAVTGCESGPGARLVRDAFDLPPRVFEVGRELAAIYAMTAGTCERFTPAVPSRFFAAREIATSRFAMATLGRE